jgi:hypothetical protein
MRNISHRSCRENQTTHLIFNNFLEKIMPLWKNIVDLGWPQMTIWLMHIACWKPKATNTHSGGVISIAFPLQQ